MSVIPAAAAAGVGEAEIKMNGFVGIRAITVVYDWMVSSPITFLKHG